MNWIEIEKTLRERHEADWSNRRLLTVARLVRRHHKKQARRDKNILAGRNNAGLKNMIEKQVRHVTQTIDRGGLVIAFDAEWAYEGDREITELGIAAFHNGDLHVDQLYVQWPGKHKRHNRMGRRARFLSPDAAREYLKELWPYVDIVVGHGLESDRKEMKHFGFPLAGKTIYDTLHWSRHFFPEEKKHRLTHFARYAKTPWRSPHIAGNDAALVLESVYRVIGKI